MNWSEFLGDQDERGVCVAHVGEEFTIESLTLLPKIIMPDELDDTGQRGMQIIVKCGDLELTRETQWGLGFEGDPNDPENKRFLESVISVLAPEAIYQAHINMRAMFTQTQKYLKTLDEARRKMSVVVLTHESGNRIKLSLDLARQVLFIKMHDRARANINPFRLQRERPGVAVVFDEVNRVMGRIGFNPIDEKYRTSEGRFGCYNLPDAPGEEYDA